MFRLPFDSIIGNTVMGLGDDGESVFFDMKDGHCFSLVPNIKSKIDLQVRDRDNLLGSKILGAEESTHYYILTTEKGVTIITWELDDGYAAKANLYFDAY